MTLNLATMLRESARANPSKAAVLFDGGALTYAEIDALSDHFAAGLRREGIKASQAVALQLPNIPQFVIAYFGILKAGGAYVPLASGLQNIYAKDSNSTAVIFETSIRF